MCEHELAQPHPPTYTQIENSSDGVGPSFYIWENWGLGSGHFSLECSVTLVCHLCVADARADTVPNPVPKQEENSLCLLPLLKLRESPRHLGTLSCRTWEQALEDSAPRESWHSAVIVDSGNTALGSFNSLHIIRRGRNEMSGGNTHLIHVKEPRSFFNPGPFCSCLGPLSPSIS